MAGLLPAALAAANPAAEAELGTQSLVIKNPGIEEGTASPASWKAASVEGVELRWDRVVVHGGKGSLCLKKSAQRFWPIAQWSQPMSIPATSQPRKLTVRCWVKAENASKAVIDVMYNGSQRGHSWAVFIGQKQPTDAKANHDWKLCEGTVDVPAGTSALTLAFQIYGPGMVWFDDLEASWQK